MLFCTFAFVAQIYSIAWFVQTQIDHLVFSKLLFKNLHMQLNEVQQNLNTKTLSIAFN